MGEKNQDHDHISYENKDTEVSISLFFGGIYQFFTQRRRHPPTMISFCHVDLLSLVIPRKIMIIGI